MSSYSFMKQTPFEYKEKVSLPYKTNSSYP